VVFVCSTPQKAFERAMVAMEVDQIHRRWLTRVVDKLEGVLQSQQNVLQQLANHLGSAQSPANQLSPHSVTSQQHAPQAEVALFMQTPNMYPGAAPAGPRYPGDVPQVQQAQMRQHRSPHNSIHIPAAPNEAYAASNPPLESPSLVRIAFHPKRTGYLLILIDCRTSPLLRPRLFMTMCTAPCPKIRISRRTTCSTR